MPPKKAARKDPKDQSRSWREDQRRLRNRLSQKAVRERKAARVQQLEQQLAAVSKGDYSARVEQLLNVNSRLRQELLDTRKKLASLSATATQLSDRIRIVLDEHSEGEPQTRNELNPADASQEHDQGSDQRMQWEDGSLVCSESSPSSIDASDSTALDLQLVSSAEIETAVETLSDGMDFAPQPEILDALAIQPDEQPSSLEGLFDDNELSEAMAVPFPGPHDAPRLRVFTGSTFSQHLNYIHKLLRLGDVREGAPSTPQTVEVMVSAFLEHGWPSLKYWMHVTQSVPLACSVLWWQTSNSQEAATRVPPGNTPTLIQLSRPKYPRILDWVPHPGMRDLLIVNYESYDVDQVICDMTNAFVVEVDDNTPVFDESGVLLPVVGNGCGYNLMQLVEWTTIFGPMNNQNNEQFTLARMLQNMASSQYASVHPIHRFKLDPRFFQKYPGLYDPNAESRYWPKDAPSVTMSQLPPPVTPDAVQAYMTAALEAKSCLAGS